jgi:UDP-N-acetylmuramyl pentapeptide phosphotransferase/UDP-N-acetylglucosamine-1-phosphate transferase
MLEPISILVAFALSAITAFMVKRIGIVDHPNDRSSHDVPTPRGGGLGIIVGFVAGIGFAAEWPPAQTAALLGIALSGVLAALLGLLDDVYTLKERPKFAILAAISVLLAAMIGPVTDLGFELPWIIGLFCTALWVFTAANTVNFMDGSDGMMVSSLIPASLALAWMGEGVIASAGFALAAGLAGFAIWNAPLTGARGQLFAGDVGSLGAAVIFAGIALYWAVIGPSGTAWLAALLILPLLGDVLLTMASRLLARQRLFSAHRSHAYQLLLRMGHSHGRVAAIWAGLSLAAGGLALIGDAGPLWLKPALFWLGVAITIILHRRVRHSARAAGLDVTQ